MFKDGEQEKEEYHTSQLQRLAQCEEECDDDPFEDQSHRIFEYPQDDDNDCHVVQDDCDDIVMIQIRVFGRIHPVVVRSVCPTVVKLY